MVQYIEPFKERFAEILPADQSSVEIPEEMLKAWLHLIMSLICITKDSILFETHITIACRLVDEGMKKVIQRLLQNSLLDKSVFMPFEVALLVNFQLLRDITGPHPDITDSYREYLNSLVRSFVNIL